MTDFRLSMIGEQASVQALKMNSSKFNKMLIMSIVLAQLPGLFPQSANTPQLNNPDDTGAGLAGTSPSVFLPTDTDSPIEDSSPTPKPSISPTPTEDIRIPTPTPSPSPSPLPTPFAPANNTNDTINGRIANSTNSTVARPKTSIEDKSQQKSTDSTPATTVSGVVIGSVCGAIGFILIVFGFMKYTERKAYDRMMMA